MTALGTWCGGASYRTLSILYRITLSKLFVGVRLVSTRRPAVPSAIKIPNYPVPRKNEISHFLCSELSSKFFDVPVSPTHATHAALTHYSKVVPFPQ
jgi:hypothetical protein